MQHQPGILLRFYCFGAFASHSSPQSLLPKLTRHCHSVIWIDDDAVLEQTLVMWILVMQRRALNWVNWCWGVMGDENDVQYNNISLGTRSGAVSSPYGKECIMIRIRISVMYGRTNFLIGGMFWPYCPSSKQLKALLWAARHALVVWGGESRWCCSQRSTLLLLIVAWWCSYAPS